MNEPSFLTNKFDRVMWKYTNFLLWRYVRFTLIGLSLVTAVFVVDIGLWMFQDGRWLAGIFDVVMFFANGFIFLLNLSGYRKKFWND